jgi:hypothetical protein
MTKDELHNILSEYFLDNPEGSYTYELTRVKEAFNVGTMGLEDFVEWDEDNVEDLTNFLWSKLNNKKR